MYITEIKTALNFYYFDPGTRLQLVPSTSWEMVAQPRVSMRTIL